MLHYEPEPGPGPGACLVSKQPHIQLPAHQPTMSIPHAIRTATSTRSAGLHKAKILTISHPTPSLRHLILQAAPELAFEPGQWLDVHCPGIAQPGGFSIISPPEILPRLELSVQRSVENPAAEWLWGNGHDKGEGEGDVVGRSLMLRVGGDFVFPPNDEDGRRKQVEGAVFVAGGVGINPILSMLASKAASEKYGGVKVGLLYSSRKPWAWAERLATYGIERMRLFETGGEGPGLGAGFDVAKRRIGVQDVVDVVKEMEERVGSEGVKKEMMVVYVCGPQGFTDFLVEGLERTGMDRKRVLVEKWW